MEKESESKLGQGMKRTSDGSERGGETSERLTVKFPAKYRPRLPPPPPTDEERQRAAEASVNMFREHIGLFLETQRRAEKKNPPGVITKLVLAPRDGELILHFLSPKVTSKATPCVPLLPECDVFSKEPWNLPIINPGKEFGYNYVRKRNERYFFQRKSVYPMWIKKGYKRSAGEGYWECYRHGVEINDSEGKAVGWKDFYEFKINDSPSTEKIGWIMEAYNHRWARTDVPSWIICKIYKRKRGKQRVDDGSFIDNRRLPATGIDSQLPNIGDLKAEVEAANNINQAVNLDTSGTTFDWSSSESSDESSPDQPSEESSESESSEESTD